MPVISSVNHEDLAAVADGEVGGLVVTKKAVIRVLEGLLAASWTPEQAHVWATFVRWGVAGTWVKGEKGRRDLMPIAASVPYFPLDIEFDEADEDRIVEVVARLDEIGDFIDGHVSTREQHQLLEFLRQP
jgi:hypothetical protein